MKNNMNDVKSFLENHRILFASVKGTDGKTKVYPLELCFESDSAFFFASAKCDVSYTEISLSEILTLCTYDENTGTVLYMKGKPVFTEEKETVSKCLRECGMIRERWAGHPEMIIAWFLKDMICEFMSVKDGTRKTAELGTPKSMLVGIEIRKTKELKERLAKLMTEREEQTAPGTADELSEQKLYDGALLYFAESAKKVWPRLDIQPAERSVLFETYDERERFAGLARKLIGNAVIDKPEDITYCLNKKTLGELMQKHGKFSK